MTDPFSKLDNQIFMTLFRKHIDIDSLPRYSAVESRLCVLRCLAKRIEAPKETAHERRTIYIGRDVSLPHWKQNEACCICTLASDDSLVPILVSPRWSPQCLIDQ